ncbi:MAG: site-specific DNA-methyltransferase [Dehalococcoidia bacterium]|nr:site-specific DNA-methyltransferase [Dehalococcoidia bacterium]
MYAAPPDGPSEAYLERPVPPEALDHVLLASSQHMSHLPDNSVHLMVTSPPYNAGKEYDQDLTLGEYVAFLSKVWQEVFRVLVPGGRACVNVANLGRRPYLPIHASILSDMIGMGFLMRGEIIWQKGSSAGGSTAWGSWKSPANPTLRDTHEYILVFSKGSFGRPPVVGRAATISREEFLEFTKSVWAFNSESARKVGHPAPFPVELPYRLIQLYTYQGEVVLDPFMGSGQTALAALKAGRHYVGYEVDESYQRLAQRRIKAMEGTPLALGLFDASEETPEPKPPRARRRQPVLPGMADGPPKP